MLVGEVVPDPRPEVLGLADVEDVPRFVLVEVDSGQQRQAADFIAELHRDHAHDARLSDGAYT